MHVHYLRSNYSWLRPKFKQLLASHLSLGKEIFWQQRSEVGDTKNNLSFNEIAKRLGISPEFQGEPHRQPYPDIVRTCASECDHGPFRMSKCTCKVRQITAGIRVIIAFLRDTAFLSIMTT